ncbi:MAG: tetratricopeptide repeat protein [Alphaproteobacteria bacterium]|nr:tetratricopeptide repeat protein [Alphaproteobacteria bacterium]
MNTQILLGISLAAFAVTAPLAPANGAVTVIGGGMAQECYQAVEFSRISTTKALELCDLSLMQENLRRKDRAATLVNRGILHMRDGRFQRALDDYERSLDLQPNLLEAKVNVGAALYGLKRYEEAMVALNEGIGTESLNARAVGFYNRALCHERLGDVTAAYLDFRSALEAKPDFELAAEQLKRFTVLPKES